MLWWFSECKIGKKAVVPIFSISLSQVHNRILHQPISGVKERMIPSWGAVLNSTNYTIFVLNLRIFILCRHFDGDIRGFATLSQLVIVLPIEPVEKSVCPKVREYENDKKENCSPETIILFPFHRLNSYPDKSYLWWMFANCYDLKLCQENHIMQKWDVTWFK